MTSSQTPRALDEPLSAPPMLALVEDSSPFRADMIVGGKYRLVRPIGRGAMAEVWLAQHVGLKNDVAIKFVLEEHTDSSDESTGALERFRFEAQISARLGGRTKHVVAVYDVGVQGITPYLVMELVPGHTLESEIERQGPLDPARLSIILTQVAEALGSAHAMGIVHRDVKPSNILILEGEGGRPFAKVADFGVAKALRADTMFDRPRATGEGLVVGSPAFMSPEQIRADGEIGATSDVWSLAVVAYEALTGMLPFGGRTTCDLAIAVATEEHVRASSRRTDLPLALDAWFARGLAKTTADRFESPAAMAEAFAEAIRPPSIARRKRPGLLALGAVMAVALSVIVIASLGRPKKQVEAAPAKPVAVAAPSPPENVPVENVAPPPSPPTAAPAPADPPKIKGAAPARATQSTPPPPAPVSAAPPPKLPPKEINPSEIQ